MTDESSAILDSHCHAWRRWPYEPPVPDEASRGTIEQVGPPRELYEQPTSDFVMGFLGPVTELGGQLVRPHDLHLSVDAREGAAEAMVARVTHLGFEVRVDLILADGRPASVNLNAVPLTNAIVPVSVNATVEPAARVVAKGILLLPVNDVVVPPEVNVPLPVSAIWSLPGVPAGRVIVVPPASVIELLPAELSCRV